MIPRVVTQRALIRRINRKLAHEGEFLRTARRFEPSLGQYYIIDLHGNYVAHHNINPEQLGRDLGVLTMDEQVST